MHPGFATQIVVRDERQACKEHERKLEAATSYTTCYVDSLERTAPVLGLVGVSSCKPRLDARALVAATAVDLLPVIKFV